MIYWELFLGFLEVGCFAFGGGYGAVALIRDVVLRNGWLTDEAITRMVAISESTPGPIMVNMATYVGAQEAGFWGAVAATFAVVLPSFLILLIIAAMLHTFLKNPWVQSVLDGIKPCVVGIILATGICVTLRSLGSDGTADWRACLILVLLAAASLLCRKVTKKKLSSIATIILSAVLGIIIYGI